MEKPIHITSAEEKAKLFASKIPKTTNFNNTKSRKYFSTKNNSQDCENTMTIKDNLLYTITLTDKLDKQEQNSTSTRGDMIICRKEENCESNLRKRYTNHRKNSSNILKVSKEILKFAERKSTPKVLVKIPAKFMEEDDAIIESEDEEINENFPNNFKQNRTVDNVKLTKAEDSICVAKEKLNNTDIDFLNSNHKLNINFESLLIIITLYTDLLRELEIKNYKQLDYNKLVERYFDVIINSYDSIYILETSLNDKCIQSALKQYFIQEILIYSLIYNRNLDKSDVISVTLYNAFKTSLFYLHQNLIILFFICCVVYRKNVTESFEKESSRALAMAKCKSKVNENKIWLNKNNYKKYLKANNKTVNGILKNILKGIKKDLSLCNNSLSTFSKSKNFNDHLYGIINNYVKNILKFKIEVIRDNIYKNIFISEIRVTPESEFNNNTANIDRQTESHFISEVEKSEEKIENFSNANNFEGCDENNENSENSNTNVNVIPPAFPYLPEKVNFSKKYTLVLDLDETLVHYVEDEESAYIQIRPGAENFLEEMFEYFELVVFTAAMQDVKNNYINKKFAFLVRRLST
jgi:hypothetical protein